MISEDLLERGLTAAADSYDVPPAAVDELREQLAPRAAEPRRRRPAMSRRVLVVSAAAGAVAIVAIAVAVGGSGGSNSNTTAVSNGTATFSGPGRVDGAGIGGGAATTAGPAGASGAVVGGARPAASAPLLGSVHSKPVVGSAGGTAAQAAPATPAIADSGAKVVKTGEMDLQVDKGKVASTLNQLAGIATLANGYIADSHTDEGGDPSGSVTLRVPVAAFEPTLQDVRQIHGVKVMSQQINGSDVTSSYVDLQARVSALEATRTTFERLLARATTIGDILAVQSRVTDVQTQIEQLQGQIRVLNDQSSLGTLTVTVDQKVTPITVAAHHRSGMAKAWHRSVSRFVNGIEAIVGILGPVLLVLLLVAAAIVVGRLGYRRLRRQLV